MVRDSVLLDVLLPWSGLLSSLAVVTLVTILS